MKWAITDKRPLSWSAISSFEYDPEQWYRNYVLGVRDPATKEMMFGSLIGNKIAKDRKFIPELPRARIFEYELRGRLDGIPLVGFIDSYTPHSKLKEYKTGKKAWDQNRADTHGQIDMYLLLLNLMHRVKPEKIGAEVIWLPTMENGAFEITFRDKPVKPIVFPTTRDMVQILTFGRRIKSTYIAMQKYAESHV